MNTIVADALVTDGARSTSVMELTMQEIFVNHVEGFQLSATPQCLKMFPQNKSAGEVLNMMTWTFC